jgi:PIN domain nuclease of toxin-antitoxin system
MRLLLDTHIFLWCTMDDPRLTQKARTLILSAQEVYVSSASIWEASIKKSLGKLEVSIEKLVDEITQSGFLELPITSSHAAYVGQLPHLHRDPFDRILIAQAICEPLHLLTVDATLKQYTDLVEVVN